MNMLKPVFSAMLDLEQAAITENREAVNFLLQQGYGLRFSQLSDFAKAKIRQMLQIPADMSIPFLLLCILRGGQHYYLTEITPQTLRPLPHDTVTALYKLIKKMS
jgi:hypothetical protein